MSLIYWSSTSLISLLLLLSAFSYLFHKPTIQGIRGLGFPDYFRNQLAGLKLVASIVLLAPPIPLQIKEWAYAGVGLFLITAIIAHTVRKDALIISLFNGMLFILLAVSNIYLHKLLAA